MPGDKLVQLLAADASRMVLGQFGKATAKLDVLKHRRHRVVVVDRNRIEFVVMAAGTADGYAERRGADGLQDLVHAIGAGLPRAGRFLADGGNRDMRPGNQDSPVASPAPTVSPAICSNRN